MGTKRYYYCFIKIFFINLMICNAQFRPGNNPFVLSNQFNPQNNYLNSIGLNQKELSTSNAQIAANLGTSGNTAQYPNNCDGNNVENTPKESKITLKNLRFLNSNDRVLTNPSQVSEVAALSNPGTASSLASLFANNRLSNLIFKNIEQNSIATNFPNESPCSSPPVQQTNQPQFQQLSDPGFEENQVLQPISSLNNQGNFQTHFGNFQLPCFIPENKQAIQPQPAPAQQNIPGINSQIQSNGKPSIVYHQPEASQPSVVDHKLGAIQYMNQLAPGINSEAQTNGQSIIGYYQPEITQSQPSSVDQKLQTMNQLAPTNHLQQKGYYQPEAIQSQPSLVDHKPQTIQYIIQSPAPSPANQLSATQQQGEFQSNFQAGPVQTQGIDNQQPVSNYKQPTVTQQKNTFAVQQQNPVQSYKNPQVMEQPSLTAANPSPIFQVQQPNNIFSNNQGQLQSVQNQQTVQAQPTVHYLPASILKAIEELKPNQGNVPVIVLDSNKWNTNALQENQLNQQIQTLPQQVQGLPQQIQGLPQQTSLPANQNQPIIILQTQEPQSNLAFPSQPQHQNQPFIVLQSQQPSSVQSSQQPTYNFLDNGQLSLTQSIQQATQQGQQQSAVSYVPQNQQSPKYDYVPSPALPSTHQPSKSSNLKVLLPLLMNLIKERNNDGCRQCNCGYHRPPEAYISEYNKHDDYSDEISANEIRDTKSKYSKSKESSEEILGNDSEEHIIESDDE